MKVLWRVFLWEIDGGFFFMAFLRCIFEVYVCERRIWVDAFTCCAKNNRICKKKINKVFYSNLMSLLFFLWLRAFIKCGYMTKKRGLLDFLGSFTKCRRELSLGTKNEIALALWNGYTSVHLPSDSTGAHLSQSWKSLLLKWHCLLTARLGTRNQIWVWLTYSIVPWF